MVNKIFIFAIKHANTTICLVDPRAVLSGPKFFLVNYSLSGWVG